MERVTIGDLKPDLTIILDVPVEIGLKRAAARRGSGAPDRFEAEDIKFHQDLRDAYRQIAADEPQRCVLIDASADRRHGRRGGSGPRCAIVFFAAPASASSGMSARKAEPEIAVTHPRETSELFGHREAEAALLNAYRSGRIPHAWLIGGAQGIGKATLAYRMARFVLAHRDPLAPPVQRAETLAVDPDDPVARQIAAGAHGGLLALERGLNDKRRDADRDHRRRDARDHLVLRLDRGGRRAGGSASSIPSTSSIRTRRTRC